MKFLNCPGDPKLHQNQNVKLCIMHIVMSRISLTLEKYIPVANKGGNMMMIVIIIFD